jgi:uncharacterized protein YdeI (BOF family)
MSRKRRKPKKIVAKLRRLGYRRLSVWPRYPQQDPAAQRHITDLVKAGIQNTLAKNQSNSGGFTLGRRGVGRQAQTATVRTTAATIRSDVARITLRMRQIRGDEIIFSDRRGRIRDMVRFLHWQDSRRHVILLPINMGIACLRHQVGRMKLW